MKNEWRRFDPKNRNTHPKDNSRVLMKYADGTQISGGYLKGHFLNGGVILATAVVQTKHWRYAE